MTKVVTIICNHCRAELRPDHGHGIYFTGNKTAEVTAIKNAETHLCPDCAQGYAQALKAVYP